MKEFRQILINLIALFLLASILPSYAEDNYRYWGKIHDQDDNPISDVNIHVYDLSKIKSPDDIGFYVKTVKSKSDGTYTIHLYLGHFRFVYERNGYITKTLTIEFVTRFRVNLRTITLQRTIDLVLPGTQRTAYSGMRLTVPFQIYNLGEKEEAVTLSAICEAGWETSIRDKIGEVGAITLKPGTSLDLSLVVNVPIEARGDTQISLHAQSHVDLTQVLNVSIQEEHLKLINCSFPSKIGSQGEAVNFKVTLSNPLIFASEAKLQVKGLPADWNSMALNDEGDRITSVYLPSEGTDEVTLCVGIPQEAKEGSYYFEVEVSCGGRVDSTTLGIEVEHRILTVELKTKYPFQMVELGKEVSFPITLENLGGTDEAISLAGENLREGWWIGFTNEMGAYIQSVLLEARGEETITVVVKPATDAKPGVYGIRVEAVSQNFEGSLQLTVGLMGSTDMKLMIANLYDQMTVGETKSIRVEVENTGYSPLSIVGLEASPSVDLLKVECEPPHITSIEPGETVDFILEVTALEGTAQGDYLLDVKAVSREMATEPVQIRLTVSASSSQTLIAGVVIAVAFASILLVYRKFKRR